MAKKQKELEKARAKAEKEARKAKAKIEKDAKKAGKNSAARGQSISIAELNHFGPEDRIAVMDMVKSGELTIEEAMIKVKSEAAEKELAKQNGGRNKRAARDGMNRQGGVKKANRGRLHLELMVVGPDKEFSIVVLKINKAYDLDALEADPYLQVELRPDPNNPAQPDIKKTSVHKKTRNPIFNDTFQWSIRSKTIDLETVRLHITCYDQQGTVFKRNQFMGSMSFSLAEVWDPESSTEGWFKLMDEKKGVFLHQKFVPKLKARPGEARPPALPPSSQSTPSKRPPAQIPAQSAAPAPSSKKGTPSASVSASKKSARKAAPPKVTASDFTYTKVLGRGSFGKVLLAEKAGESDVFAIKVLKKTSVVEDDDVAGTMTEKRVLELSQGSPFLTKLHATFQTDDRLFFVMEFVNGGDLMYHIQNERVFPVQQSQFYAAEILLGLWFLHENGVVYRDLKLDNVMLDQSGHIKIADFGMCKENIFGGAKTTTFCGTPGYLAPEIINEAPYGPSVDFWSLGVLCYEFLVGDSPFDADEDEELFQQILHAKVQFPREMSPAAQSFVDQLLNRDPVTRLGCKKGGKEEIKRHAFFAGLDWDKLAKRQLPPPFKPTIKDPKKAECFDDEFTQEDAVLTPIDQRLVVQIEQSEFKGFSFVNPKGVFHALVDQAGGDAPEPVINKNDLRQFSWYRPNLGRQDVVSLLKGRAAGAFCVRDSASQPGCYALSVSVSPKADKLWTGLITPTDDGRGGVKFRLFVKQKFDTVADLIDYYHQNACVTIDKGKREVVLKDVSM